MKYHKKVLKNGLRIITIPMKDNPTVTVLVMVEAGSKYESKKQAGISHFLEHMCFKGTEKRPQAIKISEELDSIGAQHNAFTGQEYTGYYAKSHPKHLDTILDVVSDIYLNPTLDSAEIQKEKGVIIEEINMYLDMPQHHVHDLMMELLYGDQPAGRGIAGTKETVSATTREDFIKYRTEHYVSEATTVIVSGNIDSAKTIKSIEKVFRGIPVRARADKEKVVEKQTVPQIKVHHKKGEQTHLVLACRGYDAYDKRLPAVKVMRTILGGGMSSRLFHKLRNEMGVCYYVSAHHTAFTDHGFFDISIGVDNARVHEVIKVVLDECKKMTQTLVDKIELKKVKEYLAGGLYLGLESSDSLAEYYGFQEIMRKDLKKPDQVLASIKKVTAKDVQNVAKDIFQNKNLNLAIIGDFQSGGQFTEILKF